ncbi:MAG: hypothetical protein ACFIN5_00060 [Candidatus Walczuchella monophlebidarum]
MFWLGNIPNVLFIIIAFSMLIFWLYQIAKFGQEDNKMEY